MIAPASDLPRASLSIAPLIRTGFPCADTRPAPIQTVTSMAAASSAPTRSQEARMDGNPFRISVLARKTIITRWPVGKLSQFVAEGECGGLGRRLPMRGEGSPLFRKGRDFGLGRF